MASHLTVPRSVRAVSGTLTVTNGGGSSVHDANGNGTLMIDRLPCIYCGTRRLACDYKLPHCGGCVGRRDKTCTYDWTLGAHIYDLFPAGMNLNGQLRIALHEFQRHTAFGGAARVYKTGTSEAGFFAVKVLFENRDIQGRALQLATREAWTWSRLHHENIVPFTGIADLRSIAEGGLTQLCLVSPWMEAGHITFYVNSNSGVKRMRLLWDIVKGVEYLHANQVTHGDLKGNNVLVDLSSGHPRARLTDFGASYAKGSWSDNVHFASSSKAHWGNVRWMAFERIHSQDLRGPDANSQQSDVFEMMRTFLEVLTGKPPFQEVLESRIAHYVMEGKGNNPKRPQGRIDGLDDSMWRLMIACWNHDRNRRPGLANIYDEVEARVLSEALSSHDTAYLEAIDATGSAITRFVSHASPITRSMLLESLCYTLEHTPQALYEHVEFEKLLTAVIESLAPLAGDQPLDPNNAGLYKAAFRFLGTFARFAATIDPAAWILATQGRLSLSTLVSGILGAEYLDPEDFQDILSMVLQDMESSAEARSPAALDDALIRMSRLMGANSGESAHLEDYWQELLRHEFLQDQLLMRIHAEEESQVDWASIFSTIVSWLHDKAPTDPECDELLATLLGKVALHKFLGHSAREHEVDANLEAVALVLQLRNGFRPINQDDLETILPILCRYVEIRSEFDQVDPCMRLFAVPEFRDGLSTLIMLKNPPVHTALMWLARILKVASFRLIANPFDVLFPTLASLPWISLISVTAGYSSSDDHLLIGILDNLANARARACSMQDDLPPYQYMPGEDEELEQQVVLPLIARYLTATGDHSLFPACVRLITSPQSSLGPALVHAFTSVNATEQIFTATCKIWYWAYAHPTVDPSQSQLSRWILNNVPLDQQISNILLPELLPTRHDPLLRILAQRLDVQSKEELQSNIIPALLYLIQKYADRQWVASEYRIVDMVRNEKIIAAAFHVLNSRNLGAEIRSHAVGVIVAASRVTRGKSSFILQHLTRLEIRTMEHLISELNKIRYGLASFWELLLYRLLLDPMHISESNAALLPRLIPLAVAQIGRSDEQAAFPALLVIQRLYEMENNLSRFSSSLPAFISPKLPNWLLKNEREIKHILRTLPFVHSAGTPIPVSTDMLASFRDTMNLQMVQSPVSPQSPPPRSLGARTPSSDAHSAMTSPSLYGAGVPKRSWMNKFKGSK
ncbi:hypothetical protein CALCODRAFT_502466 [Calocera cornea HHB12733]|uniref:Kinase-like protein n=1 Tax=Calocera cornea HHB12733 TaxID=1353952 RepID=A0A165D8H4_9BASI|nr:hypothetical protein CALCODRAFT_502466 [Calocera cornea HHB12733]